MAILSMLLHLYPPAFEIIGVSELFSFEKERSTSFSRTTRVQFASDLVLFAVSTLPSLSYIATPLAVEQEEKYFLEEKYFVSRQTTASLI